MRQPCTPAQIPTTTKHEHVSARKIFQLCLHELDCFAYKALMCMKGLLDAYTAMIKGGALLFITYALFVTPLALELADHWRMGGAIVALFVPIIWAVFMAKESK